MEETCHDQSPPLPMENQESVLGAEQPQDVAVYAGHQTRGVALLEGHDQRRGEQTEVHEQDNERSEVALRNEASSPG